MMKNLQDTYFKTGICFGCGPMNPKGLQIKSVVEGDQVVCLWQAEPHHQAFPGVINGGIIGTLIDCHANWSAAWTLMQQHQQNHPPCTVTAAYGVKLLKPTPLEAPLRLVAKLQSSTPHSATIEVVCFADDTVTATGEGTFVAVKPGHPAYHRW